VSAPVTSRERLLSILNGMDKQAKAVLCPGGMMSMAVTEIMEKCGASWPEAHTDARAMAKLALAMQEATGFDSIAVPFCMTVEAEAYGARVNLGSATSQPRVMGSLIPVDTECELPHPDFSRGRAATLLEAISIARAARGDVVVIGNVPGPFSLLGMLTDPLMMMRWTRREPERLKRYLSAVTADLAAYARLQAAAGAEVLCIAEPTATGEILGGRLFREFVFGPLETLISEARSAGLRVIVHICGDVASIERELMDLSADAVSFDSMVDIIGLKGKSPSWRAMGNLSPFLLAAGKDEAIRAECERLVAGGVRLVSPGCGVVSSTGVSALRTMVEVAGRV